jgi:hypothetical protein
MHLIFPRNGQLAISRVKVHLNRSLFSNPRLYGAFLPLSLQIPFFPKIIVHFCTIICVNPESLTIDYVPSYTYQVPLYVPDR